MQQRNKNKRATEQKWTFTNLKKRRDDKGRTPDDPNFNPRTLFVPSSVISTMSLMEKQYWEIKMYNMDKILFFQVGNTYQLFEEDATIASSEFGLEIKSSRNGGPNMFYASIPLKQLDEWKQRFVERGYKVAIVLESLEIQDSGNGTIHKREVTEMITPGLRDGSLLVHDNANYLLAIREDSKSNYLGICFVEVSTGKLYIENIEDDEKKSLLEMIIRQIVPSEIVLPRRNYSKQIKKIIHSLGKPDILTEFELGTEFPYAHESLQILKNENYFNTQQIDHWPEAIQFFAKKIEEKENLAISALGAIISYLKKVDKDKAILSKADISRYNIQDDGNYMLLDGHSLSNLEILTNNEDFTKRGSLLDHMCHCVTPGGKRLFSYWLSHPLQNANDIENRLDMIEDLNLLHLDDDFSSNMKSIPDIERLLQQIFSYHIDSGDLKKIGIQAFRKNERDKANLFFKIITGLKSICLIILEIKKAVKLAFDRKLPLKSLLLNSLLNSPLIDHQYEKKYLQWEDVLELLEEYQNSFTIECWNNNEEISFIKGIFQNYDILVETRNNLLLKINKFIENLQKSWRSNQIKMKSYNTIEVPEIIIQSCSIPSDWEIKTNLKNGKVYIVPELTDLDNSITEVTNELYSSTSVIFQNMLKMFTNDNKLWKELLLRFSTLDCLLSLAKLSNSPQYVRPEIIQNQNEITLEILQGRHPIAENQISNYIPNDIHIGGHYPNTIIITGPNMGGKSTILKQTAIIAIMAQIGSFVPAEKCTLTPIDRIFTRIGANDRILKGESTFMVEMTETSTILKYSTSRSLIILDELGRGTSTFDGYSIAYATLEYLVNQTKPMTLFATHFHKLCHEFEFNSKVNLLRMRFEDTSDTPLFQLEQGISPSSYGMRVARMAGINESIIQRAENVAENFKELVEVPIPKLNEDGISEAEGLLFFKILHKSKNMTIEDLLNFQQEAKLLYS